MDDRSMVLADPAEITKARLKRAWVCGHCDHTNDGDDLDCDSCGNPRDFSSGDEKVIARDYEAYGAPTSTEDVPDVLYESVDNPNADAVKSQTNSQRDAWLAQQAAEKGRKRRLLKIFGGIALGIIAIIWIFSLKKEVDFKVTGFAWERAVHIDKYGPQQYSSWDYPPSGSYGISSAQEVHHYDQIYEGTECHTESRSYVCGQTDNGNGTFSDQYCSENVEVCEEKYRDEPVYATKYYYTIDEWAFHHKEEAEANDKNPHWPSDPRTSSDPNIWREGAHIGQYYLDVEIKPGSPHRDEVSFATWNATEAGDLVRGYVHPWFGYFKGLKGE